MAFKATAEQQKAIDAKGSVLVSAAAGSGKTAVLVERVAKLLTDEANPLLADKLLIVTFTNAAAAELRTRIDKRLAAEFKNNPNNLHLQRQRILLNNAKICTIDAFCIDFLKENFEVCGVNPSFKIAENATINSLRKKSLSSLINDCFDKSDEEFLSLLRFLGEDYDDSKLQKCIYNIFDFSRNMPFPNLWLDKIVERYESHADGTNTEWFDSALDYVKSTATDALLEFNQALKILETCSTAYEKYSANYNYFCEFSEKILNLCENKDWDGVYELLITLSPPKCKSLSADEKTEQVVRSLQLRDSGKKTLEKIKNAVYGTTSDLAAEMVYTLPFIRKIISLVKEFETKFYAELAKQNIMTFYMVEQTVLSTLAVVRNGQITKSGVADFFSDRFDAVLVDEYQDTNTLQDTLFSILSNDNAKLFCVGDMKQCIYKFRGANPLNFLRKKSAAEPTRDLLSNNTTIRIDLSCNFRSRKEVCRHINSIFEKILYKENSDFDYDDNEKLSPMATYPDNDDSKVEYHFVDYLKVSSKDNSEFESKLQAEAEVLANIIEDNMNREAFIRDGELLRKARYSDFTVLVRSMREKGQVYINALKKRGIPVSAAAGDILESDEVNTLLSLLKVINNPSDDIALLTVLTCPVYAFSMDELAQIRAEHKYGNFISSLMACSKNGNEKATDFLNTILSLRNKTVILSLVQLIDEILEETNMLNVFSSVEGGDVKRQNLLCVQNLAESFESERRRSIREFVGYFSELDNKDLSFASEHNDCVTVMSIHKSKGLQFPICIVANTTNHFNQQDLRDAFLINEYHGFSAVYYDADDVKIDNTVLRTVMKQAEHRQLLAEELRIFYVALTRAEEKLIMLSTYDDVEKEVEKKINLIEFTESHSRVQYPLFRKTNSYADWILESLIIDGKANAVTGKTYDPHIFYHSEIPVPMLVNAQNQEVYADPERVNRLREIYDYEYPYKELLGLESKTSVTDIVHKADDKLYRFTARPSFMQQDGLSSAERGTATHKVMQHIDFDKAKISLKNEIERLTEYLYISEDEAAAVDMDAINAFLCSEIYDRITKAAFVKREMKFLTEFPATVLNPDLPNSFADEMIVVQGAVDLVFEENGKLIILDFKTDRNKDENQLMKAYAQQLRFYSMACEKLLKKPISELFIYSFSLGHTISVK
ncbi:MAG: helicase-exonuclease AddAB subunit AddA [Acutalibacteraceae bacterium]|nr:helicase-exonuclease AddAB subunit AddA [Acutalibacteraceae bacterium]